MSIHLSTFSTGPVEKRTDVRATGHAWRAEKARQTLGVSRHLPTLRDVPTSAFHILAACAVAVGAAIGRPQVVGLRMALFLDAALAAILAAVLVYHEWTLSAAAGAPPRIEAGVLPAAALLSLAAVVAGSTSPLTDAAAVLVAAGVMATVPYLDARRRLDRCGAVARVARQLVGVVVLMPVLVAGVSAGLPLAARLAIVTIGVLAVTMDALWAEGLTGMRVVVAGAVVAATVTTVALLPGDAVATGVRAGALLVVWYAARGLAGTAAAGRLSRTTVLEYALFAAVAAAALQYTGAR